jgi:hypothetical protein
MKHYQNLKSIFISCLSILLLLLIVHTANAASQTITAKVNCERPKAGTYSLGWGTSRLIVPDSGTPYTIFRTKNSPMTDGKLCQSGDNSGAVFLRNDRTVWAYTRAD